MEQQQIATLPWPSKSPDINPIENVWGKITKKMYRQDFRPRNQDELRQKIVDMWHELITPQYTRQLVLSVPQRLQNVILKNGSMTKY